MLKQYLFRYQGHIGAYLIVAGADPTGVGLYSVHAAGSTDALPYMTVGSGSLAAMGVFETMWKENMSRQEAIDLCAEAIKAGIFNDLGSGSNVDVCVMEKDKPAQLMRNYMRPNERGMKEKSYVFPRGTTAILDEKIIPKEDLGKYLVVEDLSVEGPAGERMDMDE